MKSITKIHHSIECTQMLRNTQHNLLSITPSEVKIIEVGRVAAFLKPTRAKFIFDVI